MPFIICRPGNGRSEWGGPPLCYLLRSCVQWQLQDWVGHWTPHLRISSPHPLLPCFQINGLSTPWVSAPRLIIPNPVYRANNCRISHKKNIKGASKGISRPTWEEWASELLYLVSTQRCFLLPPATGCDRPLVRFSNLIIFVFGNNLVVINDNFNRNIPCLIIYVILTILFVIKVNTTAILSFPLWDFCAWLSLLSWSPQAPDKSTIDGFLVGPPCILPEPSDWWRGMTTHPTRQTHLKYELGHNMKIWKVM